MSWLTATPLGYFGACLIGSLGDGFGLRFAGFLASLFACIKDEFVELAIAAMSVKFKFFLLRPPLFIPAFFSWAAITCLALINYSVLLIERIISL